MSKYPYMTTRGGSKNLYYKRDIRPQSLHVIAGKKQIWKSLGTSDPEAAKKPYREIDAQIDNQIEDWKRELAGLPTVEPDKSPLTAALSNRIIRRWKNDLIEAEFKERGELWKSITANSAAFWNGDVVPFHHESIKGAPDPLDNCREDGDLSGAFLLTRYWNKQQKLEKLKADYSLGMVSSVATRLKKLLEYKRVELSASDFAILSRRVLSAEIEALEAALTDDAKIIGIEDEPEAAPPVAAQSAPVAETPAAPPMKHMSDLSVDYVKEATLANNWSLRDQKRFQAHLDEFVKIVGDKPANTYAHEDGANFRSVQLRLPALRAAKPFTRKKPLQCIEILDAMPEEERAKVKLLSPTTIKDKTGCINNFFKWVRTRDRNATNPMDGIEVKRSKKHKGRVQRVPWNVEELNAMFAAPIYTGAVSAFEWRTPGNNILNDTAKYWAPLIALFSGMRLGEIIQLYTDDIKTEHGVTYFDITLDNSVDDVSDAKSLKTETSKRKIGVHHALVGLGFLDFVERRRAESSLRLFPEMKRANDDHSWSKLFGKHFQRFRQRLPVKLRDGVDFHSLRHNAEDALRNLRNPHLPKEVRDAIQGHGENGVSAQYGTGYYLETLNEAVQRINYPGLVLPSAPVPLKDQKGGD